MNLKFYMNLSGSLELCQSLHWQPLSEKNISLTAFKLFTPHLEPGCLIPGQFWGQVVGSFYSSFQAISSGPGRPLWFMVWDFGTVACQQALHPAPTEHQKCQVPLNNWEWSSMGTSHCSLLAPRPGRSTSFLPGKFSAANTGLTGNDSKVEEQRKEQNVWLSSSYGMTLPLPNTYNILSLLRLC